jgi:hypothetical protein
MLTVLGLGLGFPLQAQAMIAATIYASSRERPMEKVCLFMLISYSITVFLSLSLTLLLSFHANLLLSYCLFILIFYAICHTLFLSFIFCI